MGNVNSIGRGFFFVIKYKVWKMGEIIDLVWVMVECVIIVRGVEFYIGCCFK